MLIFPQVGIFTLGEIFRQFSLLCLTRQVTVQVSKLLQFWLQVLSSLLHCHTKKQAQRRAKDTEAIHFPIFYHQTLFGLEVVFMEALKQPYQVWHFSPDFSKALHNQILENETVTLSIKQIRNWGMEILSQKAHTKTGLHRKKELGKKKNHQKFSFQWNYHIIQSSHFHTGRLLDSILARLDTC